MIDLIVYWAWVTVLVGLLVLPITGMVLSLASTYLDYLHKKVTGRLSTTRVNLADRLRTRIFSNTNMEVLATVGILVWIVPIIIIVITNLSPEDGDITFISATNEMATFLTNYLAGPMVVGLILFGIHTLIVKFAGIVNKVVKVVNKLTNEEK